MMYKIDGWFKNLFHKNSAMSLISHGAATECFVRFFRRFTAVKPLQQLYVADRNVCSWFMKQTAGERLLSVWGFRNVLFLHFESECIFSHLVHQVRVFKAVSWPWRSCAPVKEWAPIRALSFHTAGFLWLYSNKCTEHLSVRRRCKSEWTFKQLGVF